MNDKQKAWITEIESHATSLLLINKQILEIAKFISDKTISKILEKSDTEVALELLK